MRICVEIPDADARRLDEIVERQARTRKALLREAIADVLEKHRPSPIDDAFGLWAQTDGLEYQRRRRDEW